MRTFISLISFIFIGHLYSQSTIELGGKKFHQIDKTPDSDTYLKFNSNSSGIYIMTGILPISGKIFTDECPCSVKVSGTQISINCICLDKEIYPDPIKDSFTYDLENQRLVSGSYSISGSPVVWKLK